VSISFIPSDERILALEDAVHGVFSVHDVQVRGGGRVVVFGGQFLRSPEMVYEAIQSPFKDRGFVPLLRQENGQDIVMAYPAPAIGKPSRLWVHGLLFVLTLASTLLAGTLQVAGDDLDRVRSLQELLGYFVSHWTLGLPFAIALLGILGTHEFGHYFVARRYGLDVSLPYFIPFPLNPFTGTLGAVIRIQSPFESRKALFDVGIAGPLAGMVVAIPVVVLGLMQAKLAVVAPGAGMTSFSEPLLFQWLSRLIVGPRPPGTDIIMNPLLMAGWWGFLVTALNLVPISQLDGGHIAYALLGSRHRLLAWGLFVFAVAVTLLRSPQYLLMLILVFMMGIEHPPALDDLTPIGTPRKVLGIATLIMFLTLITLNPFSAAR
jgi:membrane-associated protease RseP (regulator of RpoE activity)